jgi:hypothetical protein
LLSFRLREALERLTEIALIIRQRIGALLPIDRVVFLYRRVRIHDMVALTLSFTKPCNTIVASDVSLLAWHSLG